MEYYTAERKKELLPFMDGTEEHYAKWNKPGVKEKCHMVSPISGI